MRRFIPPMDLSAVLKIQADCEVLDPLPQRELLRYWELHDPSQNRTYVKRLYMADTPEGIMGWLAFTAGKSLVRIDSLCVHPQWQRKGVGSALISRLIATPNPNCRRGGVFALVRESCLPMHKALRKADVPCIGVARERSSPFGCPREAGLAFLHVHDKPQGTSPCLRPQEAARQVLSLCSASPLPSAR